MGETRGVKRREGFFHEELEGEGEGERRSIGVRRRGFCKAGWFEGCLKKAPAGNWNHLVGHRDVGVLDFQRCSRNLQCKMKSVLRGSEHGPEGTTVGKELAGAAMWKGWRTLLRPCHTALRRAGGFKEPPRLAAARWL